MKFRPIRQSVLCALASLYLTSCTDSADYMPLEDFKKLCRHFKFIGAEWMPVANTLRKKIASGEINRDREISFKSGLHNSGEYRRPLGELSRYKNLWIMVIDVNYNGRRVMQMSMPTYRIKGSWISLSAPEYHELDCSGENGKSLSDYI